jgi:Arc/MetJ-type ribon-helix-helix transcriptional regulator
MSTVRTIQVRVSEEVADYIHRQVETGGFADEGEVVRHVLEEARDTDAAMENRLRQAVAEWQAAPDDVKPVDAAFDGLLGRYLARKDRAA